MSGVMWRVCNQLGLQHLVICYVILILLSAEPGGCYILDDTFNIVGFIDLSIDYFKNYNIQKESSILDDSARSTTSK